MKKDKEKGISPFEVKTITKNYYIQKFVEYISIEIEMRCFYEFYNFNKHFENKQKNSLNYDKEDKNMFIINLNLLEKK